LRRTTGDPRAVRDLLRNDLEAIDPASRSLTLAAVLECYGAATTYLVDLKDPRPGDVAHVVDCAGRHGVRRQVTLQSFDHAPLRALADEGGHRISSSPLYVPRMPAHSVRVQVPRVAGWATAVALCATSIDAAVVQTAHAHGLRVHAYTVNDEREMRRLLTLGVDGIITDVPDRLRAVRASIGAPVAPEDGAVARGQGAPAPRTDAPACARSSSDRRRPWTVSA
jgi:glycerophosphoryl diester phosphodiesterase